jgi:hypothetical protein
MADTMTEPLSDVLEASDIRTDPRSDSTTDTASDASPGDWLRKSAAAARLGISERMLDRQLAAGKWPRRTTPDGRVEVCVPRPRAESEQEAERALVWIERYQQQLEAQTAPLVARIEHLARENGALQAEVQALQAQLAAVQTARQTTAPWWARWWPWRTVGEPT